MILFRDFLLNTIVMDDIHEDGVARPSADLQDHKAHGSDRIPAMAPLLTKSLPPSIQAST